MSFQRCCIFELFFHVGRMPLSFFCGVCGRVGNELPLEGKMLVTKRWVQLDKKTTGTHIPSAVRALATFTMRRFSGADGIASRSRARTGYHSPVPAARCETERLPLRAVPLPADVPSSAARTLLPAIPSQFSHTAAVDAAVQDGTFAKAQGNGKEVCTKHQKAW